MDEKKALEQAYGISLMRQKFNPEDLDYSILEQHLELLEKINVMENSAISIFDLYQKKHIYLSPKFETMFGYNISHAEAEGNSYFEKKIHPDDYLESLKVGNYFLNYALDYPKEERLNLKLICDYRILNGKNRYTRVVEQFQALELDVHGNLWLAICTLDISPNQDITTPYQHQAIDSKKGEIIQFKDHEKPHKLSKRESQIISLISQGKASKQIADDLFISVHTVNTHRQNILEKLNVRNSHEAIELVQRYGLTF